MLEPVGFPFARWFWEDLTMFKLITISFLVLVSQTGQAATLEEAFDTMMGRVTARKKLDRASIYNHRWDFQKTHVTFERNRTVFEGKFQHYRRIRSDHNVFFRVFFRRDGTIQRIFTSRSGQAGDIANYLKKRHGSLLWPHSGVRTIPKVCRY